MSDAKLISPLLDNFVMGDPISEHNGVRCCPAIHNDTNEKFIVKIISVPTSQVQMDALLLSGAYESKEAALEYYQSLVNDISGEAETLKKLAQLEGFVSPSSWQIVPMDARNGFDIYILSPYHHTLERSLRQESMTHLSALNLALDICAALTVCRRAGYLYVDLKPDNIFILNEQDYRIGDIGFIKLNSLKYASLPDRYHSQYTAPEITDAFSALNTTLDVYALGLILYQVFNDGALPFKDRIAPADCFPPPAYADYEIAEVILKACHPDPASRWQDPVEMGQALVSYMQRNGAHDTPIVPIPEAESNTTLQDDQGSVSTPEEAINENATQDDDNSTDSALDKDENLPSAITEAVSENETIENTDEDISESAIYTVDNEGNLTFIDDTADDETVQDHNPEEIDYAEVTDEVSDILQQADDLIAHPTPAPVVQPDPIDVPVPEPISEDEPENETTDTANDPDDLTDTTNAEAPSEEQINAPENSVSSESSVVSEGSVSSEDSDEATVFQSGADTEGNDEALEPKKKSSRHLGLKIILAILALSLIAGGIFYYKNYYLQPIEAIRLEQTDEGILTVYVTSELNENKLYVLCTDAYGNQLRSPVKDGKAVFANLSPGSAFNVSIKPNGFYRLTGDTTAAYTTPSLTNILQFQATTGSEDGSVILGFTVDGPDSEQWKITYTDDSGTAAEVIFTGHMTTINGLAVGNNYVFTLFPMDNVHTAGEMEVSHTASKVTKADRVEILSSINNELTVSWKAPADAAVDSWTVRCYNNTDYDETIVTSDTSATFKITDAAVSYTVEVTAAGMSVSERAYASADALTISDFNVDGTNPRQLLVTWSADGVPANGWLLLYSINGNTPQEVSCGTENSTTISPVIPGSKYAFTLQASDGSSILGGSKEYTAPEPSKFNSYGVSADNMTFYMCRRPSREDWTRDDLKSYDYVAEFTLNEQASYLVRLQKQHEDSSENVVILFIIRDNNGRIISVDTTTESWDGMWDNRDCTLDIPALPDTPGDYSISIYFNGLLANENSFTLVP